jgi:SAM-dependent methyltransferase
MKGERRTIEDRPSLEALVECEDLGIQTLHPGGLDITGELAGLCEIRRGTAVLEVASGTGESACFLARRFGARVVGMDQSQSMIARSVAKCGAIGPEVSFLRADAHHLPLADDSFDVAISECTLCLLDKARVIEEMARVVRPGGRVGMHDLYWGPGAPESLKRTLVEIEGERPETLEGWTALFRDTGLLEIITIDKKELISRWMRAERKQLGWSGQLALALKALRRWGVRGLSTVLRSERVFSSTDLGYCLVVGTKRRVVRSSCPGPGNGGLDT